MLNYIWLALIVLAVLIGGFHGNLGAVGDAAVDKAKYAVYPLAHAPQCPKNWDARGVEGAHSPNAARCNS